MRQRGDRGYLRNVEPHDFNRVDVPTYQPPPPPAQSTTLHDATLKYVSAVSAGTQKLIDRGDVPIVLAAGDRFVIHDDKLRAPDTIRHFLTQFE
jgi:hypothetical protein